MSGGEPDHGQLAWEGKKSAPSPNVRMALALDYKEAAIVLRTDQPTVSALLRGRLEGFSSDRLFRFLNALDQEIETVIRQTKKRTHAPGIRVLAIP